MAPARLLPIAIPSEQIAHFCQRHHITKLALFGSILRDDFGPDSDIDILVQFEPGYTPGFAFIDLQDQLTALLGRTVDLNTPQDLSRYFRDHVMTNAEVLYEQTSQ
jgi:predicted nucleotidyltransferase